MKQYFKKFIECINLEQIAESDRQTPSSRPTKDTKLKLESVETNNNDGILVYLEKPIPLGKTLADFTAVLESAYVNMSTENNITFSKGLVMQRETIVKGLQNSIEQASEEFSQISEQDLMSKLHGELPLT